MPNVSSITTVLPLRVPNELMERLEAMVGLLGERRNDVGREALERGLAQLEEQHASRKARPGRRKKAEAPSAPEPVAAAPVKGRKSRKAAVEPARLPEPALVLSPQDEEVMTLFAARVLKSAQRCRSGRFGEDRVFINQVWLQYKRDHKPKGIDLDTFKQWLLEANRGRYLSLVRADMAPQLDQKDVEESRIRYLSATFHFVCI